MNINFNGKRALVTGAANGIGKGVALKLLEYGAKVIAIDKDKESLEKLKNEHCEIEIHAVDLSKWEETRKLIAQLEPVDHLANIAGVEKMNSIGKISEEEVDRQFAVNMKAIINTTQEVSKRMIEKKKVGCSIVNVSSLASSRAFKSYMVYCATKAAVDQITRVSALELGEHQIRVNAVNPGGVKTDMLQKAPKENVDAVIGRTPLHRVAEVNDVANLIAYLLSDKADMITGACIPIDGGYSTC